MFSPQYLQTEQVSTAWIWYMLLALLVLLLIFWWLNRSSKREEPREMAQSQREQTADNLKQIEGIGPKVEKVLKDAGITTFDALARANAGKLQQILNAAGMQMTNPEGWIDQAKLAARGDWNGLEQLQNELKGGRKK